MVLRRVRWVLSLHQGGLLNDVDCEYGLWFLFKVFTVHQLVRKNLLYWHRHLRLAVEILIQVGRPELKLLLLLRFGLFVDQHWGVYHFCVWSLGLFFIVCRGQTVIDRVGRWYDLLLGHWWCFVHLVVLKRGVLFHLDLWFRIGFSLVCWNELPPFIVVQIWVYRCRWLVSLALVERNVEWLACWHLGLDRLVFQWELMRLGWLLLLGSFGWLVMLCTCYNACIVLLDYVRLDLVLKWLASLTLLGHNFHTAYWILALSDLLLLEVTETWSIFLVFFGTS